MRLSISLKDSVSRPSSSPRLLTSGAHRVVLFLTDHLRGLRQLEDGMSDPAPQPAGKEHRQH